MPLTRSVQQARRDKDLVGKYRIDGGKEVLAQPRFHNIGRATRAHAGAHIVRVFVHGEKDDLGVASRISQLVGDIDPAQLPKGNIQNDDIWSEPEVLADNNSPVGYGSNDLIAFLLFEHFANMIEDARIVVTNEYGCSLHKPFFESRRCGIGPGQP